MTAIRYMRDRQLPLLAEADVVVVGGGPGGLGAAVMAARAGAQTLLVERYGCLGGMATFGEVHPFMRNHARNESLDAPIYQEWIERMHRYWPREGNERAISKEAAMLAMEDLCLEAGVRLLFHHNLADAITAERRIDAAVFLSKSGFGAVTGAQYVDCTGDGDLAAMSGCEFEFGGPTGHCQPMTLCFKLCNIDMDRSPTMAVINAEYQQAKERGEIECPRENVLTFSWLQNGVVHFNTTRVVQHNGVDGLELSEAELLARKQVRQILQWFRTRIPGYEQAQLYSMAHHIGIRETRRIKGLNYITREAFEARQKFDDAIARVNYPIDIHNPTGTGTELVHLGADEWYEIPYGCVVANDIDNLTIGGRPISVDHAVHSSMRVMPPACSVGQAAGLAAAMAAAQGCRPADLNGVEVRRKLVAFGARLAEGLPVG